MEAIIFIDIMYVITNSAGKEKLSEDLFFG
jgi:hypothetical protein